MRKTINISTVSKYLSWWDCLRLLLAHMSSKLCCDPIWPWSHIVISFARLRQRSVVVCWNWKYALVVVCSGWENQFCATLYQYDKIIASRSCTFHCWSKFCALNLLSYGSSIEFTVQYVVLVVVVSQYCVNIIVWTTNYWWEATCIN